MQTPLISIVTSMYFSEKFILEFYDRITKAALQITPNYEILFVDDGSPDSSSEVVRKIIDNDKKVRLVRLSRNFGHHKATLAGIREARGEHVFMTDCDLEEPPELLPRFFEEMKGELSKADVVFGYQERRSSKGFEKISGYLFYKMLRWLGDINVPQNEIFTKLMTRAYVNNLLRFGEEHVLLTGLLQLTGYRQIGMPVVKGHKGTTVYTLGRKVSAALDAVTSFSSKPLVWISVFGISASIVATIAIVLLIIRQLFFGRYMSGWASVIASIWLVGGLSISSIGVVGLYVGRIFIQVKNRPTAIIQEIVN